MTQLRTVDLHLHTTASDGVFRPAEIVRLAAEANLSAIAVTDHDSISGLDEASTACRQLGIELIPGVEISADAPGGGDCHLLGYWFDPNHTALQLWLGARRRARIARGEEIVRRVNDALRQRNGADAPQLAWEDIAKRADIAGGGSVGRPHVADSLIAIGAVGNRDEAFATLLGTGMPGDVSYDRIQPADAIAQIRNAGGVAVLAHPTYLRDYETVLPSYVEQGLGGLECIYSDYAPSLVASLQSLAHTHGLAVTGGSDFHGPSSSAGGSAVGRPAVPFEVLGPLRDRCAQRPGS